MWNRVEVIQGDITKVSCDAIVNAANELMLGGGGVDGAIHRAAGPSLLEACKAIPEVRQQVRCPTGDCRVTPAFRLPAKFVIHTVGPIWRGGHQGEEELLLSCYRNVLRLAVWTGCRTVSFPAISCGVYRFPTERAARISIQAIQESLQLGDPLTKITLVAFDNENYDAWLTAIEQAKE